MQSLSHIYLTSTTHKATSCHALHSFTLLQYASLKNNSLGWFAGLSGWFQNGFGQIRPVNQTGLGGGFFFQQCTNSYALNYMLSFALLIG